MKVDAKLPPVALAPLGGTHPPPAVTGKVGSSATGAKVVPTDPNDPEKAATDFEALLLHQMLTEMWKTVPKDELLDGGRAGEYYQDMLNEELAKKIAKDQPIGIKKELLEGLQRSKKVEAYSGTPSVQIKRDV